MIGYSVWIDSVGKFYDFLNSTGVVNFERSYLGPLAGVISQAVFFLNYDGYRSEDKTLEYDRDYIKNYLLENPLPYFDMKIPKSDEYLAWFDRFDSILSNFGSSRTDVTKGDSYPFYFWEGDPRPWGNGGVSYEQLKETKDFFWFLVCVIQRFGSFYKHTPDYVSEVLLKFIKRHPSGIKFSIFKPLESFVYRQKLIEKYNELTIKSISKEINLDFLSLNSLTPLDVQKVPEYELLESFYKDGSYYNNEEVIHLAITAAGGMAQSLERQDLEPKILTKYQLRKKVKKNENK